VLPAIPLVKDDSAYIVRLFSQPVVIIKGILVQPDREGYRGRQAMQEGAAG
jgi:hypothetical protein